MILKTKNQTKPNQNNSKNQNHVKTDKNLKTIPTKILKNGS